jgi:DNA-binding SARP family transcriptional activator
VFLPRVMRPLPAETGPAAPAVRRLAEEPFSVVRGPAGSYIAESLAGLLAGWGRWQDSVWLRTDQGRPGALAGPLLAACRYRWAGGEAAAPARAAGGQLAEALALVPAGGVVVLELEGRVAGGLGRLGEAVGPLARARELRVIAVTQPRLPAVVPAGPALVVPAAALGGPPADDPAGLPGRSYRRLRALAGRRIAVVHDVLDAACAWSSEAVADALGRSSTLRAALDRLTANLLELCSPGQREALEVCAATGYWHPQLATSGAPASLLRPWVVPLERDWGWLRPIWSRPLRRQLAGRAGQRRPSPAPGGPPPAGPCPPAPADPDPPARGLLEARLLGSFQLRLDGRPVGGWPGQRGASVLRFLLARPGQRCSRDELLAEFWPDVAPEVARNRLQVAVSGLRRALQEVSRLQVIEYADGGYRINPELLVEVDVERFEGALSAARRAERSGDAAAAVAAYREAVELYRGDFAADVPYEPWALLPRERLRLSYLDALDRMSRIQLEQGRLDDCITTGLRMLAVDPCREDAHRLLMRCYASQGRVYQALRQYEFCARMLRATLDTEPGPETVEVYRSIRAGAAVSRP